MRKLPPTPLFADGCSNNFHTRVVGIQKFQNCIVFVIKPNEKFCQRLFKNPEKPHQLDVLHLKPWPIDDELITS
jgi:hypothetical protein